MEEQNNFNHLSAKDLIDAREEFHFHLMNKKNVVATAIGRYLIRLSDLDDYGRYKYQSPDERPLQKSARTLDNSLITDFSWPCVLVFVEKWEDEATLMQQDAGSVVPKTIYLKDGRVIPICTIKTPETDFTASDINLERLIFPKNLIGGGFPLILHSQGVDWVATVGCVVADGHKYYALSNKHVTGEGGERVYSKFGNSKKLVGTATGKVLGKKKFSELYRGWDSEEMLVNCDTGLIEIKDLKNWRTDVYDIGLMGQMVDVTTRNIFNFVAQHKLDKDKGKTTIKGKVTGFGAVSGRMNGEILGLFYRYRSVGGIEYVSDFLIGGRDGRNLNVSHGDSGTLWLFEDINDETKQLELKPIALHWGQHEYLQGVSKKHYGYSLGTCLSNVCKELDVLLVRDWNLDNDYSWGKVGHYTVGSFAIEAIDGIQNNSLKELMQNNLPNISFKQDDINANLDDKNNPALITDPNKGFCPLADVPDIIWKQSPKNTTWGRKGSENPNHYADADAPTVNGGGTLFEICDTKNKLTVKVWNDFYESVDKAKIGLPANKEISKGLISFRVWQIYDYMVEALRQGERKKFVFAAGVLAHYVGDACQPLHSSYMSNGDPSDNQTIDYTAKRDSKYHHKGDVYQKVVNPGDGVHAAYEDTMIDDYIDKIVLQLKQMLIDPNSLINQENIAQITDGQGAGFAVLTLMKLTQLEIKPKEIVELYKKAKEQSEDVTWNLFNIFGDATVVCLARGCRYLAAIWEAAWRAGSGDKNVKNLGKVIPKDLITLYQNPDELKSYYLDEIESVLK